MRKKIFFNSAITILFFCFIIPLQANHLDGLWRNDRSNITLRIEKEGDGFRAKRTDQGIWYYYTTDDNRYYYDKRGNWYELADDEELIWNESNSEKRIYFTRVDYRDQDRWENYGNTNYENNYDPHQNDWNTHSYHDSRNYLDGNWYSRIGREVIQIISFDDGIKVITDHDGWSKFYADRSGNRFIDKYSNTIILTHEENLIFRNRYTREEKLFSRYRDKYHEEISCRK